MSNTNGLFPQTFTCPHCGTKPNTSVCPRRACLEVAFQDRTQAQESNAGINIAVRKVTMGWMIETETHQVHVIRRNRKFLAFTHDMRPKLLLKSTSFLECARLVRPPHALRAAA